MDKEYTVYYVSVGFMTAVTLFQVPVANNFQALTGSMNVSYAVKHEREISFLLQCIVFIQRVKILF
jgi:hypothetical protein